MKLPRNLNGSSLADVLCRQWDYRLVHYQGSHIILDYQGSHIILDTQTPEHQRISIPNHNPLRIGTLNSILKTISAHKKVSKQDILDSL
jgi:predicted RNA binding protein YcfA (HicA-like mRNA interferase family)